MSFNFTAAGTRNEVVDQLDSLHDDKLGYDNFGSQLRDAIVDAISVGATLEPPADQRYQVAVSGHSGRDAICTFQGEVKIVHVDPQPPDAKLADNPADIGLTETPVATDNLEVQPAP